MISFIVQYIDEFLKFFLNIPILFIIDFSKLKSNKTSDKNSFSPNSSIIESIVSSNKNLGSIITSNPYDNLNSL